MALQRPAGVVGAGPGVLSVRSFLGPPPPGHTKLPRKWPDLRQVGGRGNPHPGPLCRIAAIWPIARELLRLRATRPGAGHAPVPAFTPNFASKYTGIQLFPGGGERGLILFNLLQQLSKHGFVVQAQ